MNRAANTVIGVELLEVVLPDSIEILNQHCVVLVLELKFEDERVVLFP